MSQWFLSYSLYCCCFISAYSSHNYLSLWKLAEEISLQSASKRRFQSSGPPANGNKSNAKKSRFCPNRNLTGTIYHWSVILRGFSVVLNSAKHDANGFFKVLLLSSHLLIARHPVQKSKFGACAVTGYCSFKVQISRPLQCCLVRFKLVNLLSKSEIALLNWYIPTHLGCVPLQVPLPWQVLVASTFSGIR